MGKDQTAKDPPKEGLGDILFDPKEKAKVDIVFVHGLGGGRTETWTWKNQYRTQFWPQTLLPKDCPTARIMSFGYNEDFAHFYPQSPKTVAPEFTIDNYSSSLLQALAGLREKSDTATRPIIFVAHSLGGLVVANALARPQGTEQAAKEISDRTVGTVFLGTPFEGSSIAKYGHAALGFLSHFTSTQTANLEALQKRSEKLTAITHLFAKFLKERDRSPTLPYLEVACFFEDRPLYKGPIKIGIIVPKESASWLGVDAISIPKDHQEMCRFEDEDGSDYKSVAAKLRQFIADSEKPREAGKGGLLGANAQSIGVYQGNVDMRGAQNHGGIMTGNLQTDAQNGITLTGSVNHYGPGSKPSA
ncbi:Alpha/Beta hydrolase protein [Xylaria bambusicola]|uniref:Alpha/Beta hydrolase protein n=1 Tax=Xylaria bambusicola TaxID=326684 RepID=UPI002008A76F|nr:Alpha/Beta hydrolase protein [Xylaria bambusicola]KAI0502829.1 Alpha/Beta hydrolase protein [Xylaria bambusicola]